MNDQGMTEEEANYHFERIIAENTLTLFDLKAKLTEAEARGLLLTASSL